VLDGVDLELKPSTVFVLLGANGAGKTTLMRTLCGRTSLEEGRASVLGRDPRRDAAARRAIGWVPQSVALYPALTVHENLQAFAALGRHGRAGRDRIARVLRAVRMETAARQRVGTLSGGYQRRVNLAAALVSDPAVLLLDEPTVGLDADAKQVVVEIIRAVAQDGTAILLATHDFDVAAAADRVGFLHQGKIVAEGSPRELLDRQFGARVRVRLALRRPAEPMLDATLRAAGLLLSPGEHAWCAPPEGLTQATVDGVLTAVAEGRCEVRALAVVEPGLKDLYDVLLTQGRPS
jgi:ABC-2 type transport system ATP-binding protein